MSARNSLNLRRNSLKIQKQMVMGELGTRDKKNQKSEIMITKMEKNYNEEKTVSKSRHL